MSSSLTPDATHAGPSLGGILSVAALTAGGAALAAFFLPEIQHALGSDSRGFSLSGLFPGERPEPAVQIPLQTPLVPVELQPVEDPLEKAAQVEIVTENGNGKIDAAQEAVRQEARVHGKEACIAAEMDTIDALQVELKERTDALAADLRDPNHHMTKGEIVRRSKELQDIADEIQSRLNHAAGIAGSPSAVCI